MSFFEAGMPALFSREAGPPTTHHTVLINIFLTLQILGLVGSCALVLTTTLSHRAPRNATWQNFFTSWIISTVSYSLLLFSGQVNKPEPTFGVCLAQAGLIYGIPSLTAATTFGLIAQIWFSVQELLAKKIKNERMWTIGLLILPYMVLFGMVIASWAIGIRNTSLVQVIGSGMYCHIGPSGTLGKVSAAMVALTLLPTLALEISICIALRRNWGHIQAHETLAVHHPPRHHIHHVWDPSHYPERDIRLLRKPRCSVEHCVCYNARHSRHSLLHAERYYRCLDVLDAQSSGASRGREDAYQHFHAHVELQCPSLNEPCVFGDSDVINDRVYFFVALLFKDPTWVD
ncbi:hypothetical protein MVEN_01385000 [Mycena venus]|uniref:Uncharacterized protein n=1 Tax=Mycena venus TaxID=2733690 RepID=A0A8H6XYG4_9AGAR|nr:hypothetical protein MVEN_01385000 [Mycena venus]